MAARDWTNLYKQYKGQWVALDEDEQTVIAAASTLRKVMKAAARLGRTSPHVVKMPSDLRIFVGYHSMAFRYTRYSSSVLRPVIEIGVKYRRRSLSYDVLVDSGADINVFNAELAEALGIELAAGVSAEVTGATGQIETVSIHTVTLTVRDRSYKAPVAFLASAAPYGLVGQRGFFDQFVVAFDLPHEELEITPV